MPFTLEGYTPTTPNDCGDGLSLTGWVPNATGPVNLGKLLEDVFHASPVGVVVDSLASVFPDFTLTDAGVVNLETLNVVLQNDLAAACTVTFSLQKVGQSEKPWTLMAGVLTLDSATVTLNVSVSDGNFSIEGNVNARARLGDRADGTGLELNLDFPSLVARATLKTSLGQTTTPIQDAGNVFQFEDATFGGKGLDALRLMSLSIYAEPRKPYVTLNAFLSGSWTAGPLTVSDLLLKVAYDGGTVSSVSGEIMAKGAIFNDWPFNLYAAYRGRGAGWHFSGSVQFNGKLGKAIDDFFGETALGSFTLPDFLTALELKRVNVTLDSATSAYTFALEVELSANAHVVVNVTRAGGRTTVSGSLVLNGGTASECALTVKFGTDYFVATYESLDGKSIEPKALLTALGAGENCPQFSVPVRKAAIAYVKGEAKKNWFAAIDFGSIDLSGLNGIPLLGDGFAKAGGLRLAVQGAVAQDKTMILPGQVLDVFKDIVPGVKSPPAENPQFNLMLQIGDEKIDLGPRLKQGTAGVENDTSQTATAPKSPAVNKRLGPLRIDNVAVEFGNGTNISVKVDGSFGMAGLELQLLGLKATTSLDALKTGSVPTFSMDGLGLNIDRGALAIAGTFLALDGGFAGKVTIRTSRFTITGFGALAIVGGAPSLYVYAYLDYPLGGPAFFFVEGLALGFGVNRRFTVPALEAIKDFPLVTVAQKTPAPSSTKPGVSTVERELKTLNAYLSPAIGEYFITIGVSFNSFRLVTSFALVTVAFGGELEFSLIGISTLLVPPVPKATGGSPVVYVRLVVALRAVVRPAEGLIDVSGQITQGSYVYSPFCVPTGGFAFKSWVSGPREGDFVLTLGGYHPSFTPPSHYPAPSLVPRCEFGWVIDSSTSIKGSLYFALTPVCLMAGASLQANWSSGFASAYFSMGVDFLIAWKPFHFNATAWISISGRVSFLDFDMGARVEIWGPPFGGTAHIHCGVWFIDFDFDVEFGSRRQSVNKLEWPEFKESFLPVNGEVHAIDVASGLIGRDKNNKPLVTGYDLKLRISSLIPITSTTGGFDPVDQPMPQDFHRASAFGVAPMNLGGDSSTEVKSDLAFVIKKDGTSDPKLKFKIERNGKRYPAGLWGTSMEPVPAKLTQTIDAYGDLMLVYTGTADPAAALTDIARGALKFDDVKPPRAMPGYRETPSPYLEALPSIQRTIEDCEQIVDAMERQIHEDEEAMDELEGTARATAASQYAAKTQLEAPPTTSVYEKGWFLKHSPVGQLRAMLRQWRVVEGTPGKPYDPDSAAKIARVASETSIVEGFRTMLVGIMGKFSATADMQKMAQLIQALVTESKDDTEFATEGALWEAEMKAFDDKPPADETLKALGLDLFVNGFEWRVAADWQESPVVPRILPRKAA